MTENTPPMLPVLEGSKTRHPGYPAPGTKLGNAWAAAWAELSTRAPEEYVISGDLARRAGEAAGIKGTTVANLLARMAAAGKLECQRQKIVGARGPRTHVAYRRPQ